VRATASFSQEPFTFVEGFRRRADDPNVIEVSRTSSPRSVRRWIATVGVLATVAATTIVTLAMPAPASAVADNDWLGIVNTYRAMSGLAPVGENGGWSAQAKDHSCYMLQNGISHDEVPGRPGYTAGGDIAGNSGNVAVSSSSSAQARNHIDLWMTGPFHAIGILRHNLAVSGFGLCNQDNTPTPWHSGGTLDVVRGIDSSRARPATPITFPGNGATVPLNRFVTEFPNPMTFCGWTGNAGLPLIVMMPNKVSSAQATITGPNGPVGTCTLHAGNTGSDATARSILDGDNAVVVMPRDILANGSYSVNVTSNGGAASWTFNVDTAAGLAATPPKPPPAPDTAPSAAAVDFEPVDPFRLVDTRDGQGARRIGAGQTVRIKAAGTDVTALSANFVAVNPSGPGHLTVYNCTSKVPEVSTLGYAPGAVTANQAIVPLSKGEMCIYAHQAVDVVVDVNGFYRNGEASAQFTPVNPARLYDTRTGGGRLRAGQERKVRITGTVGGPPVGVDAVSMNVTAVGGSGPGHLQVYPCGAKSSLETSTINYAPGEARPNTVVVRTDDQGQVCLKSVQDLDVAIDYTGHFAAGNGYEFTALNPIRLFDSRTPSGALNEVTGGQRLRAGQVVRLAIAGSRGIPADAKAASVNLTVTQSTEGLHVTAFPCGKLPATSSLNVAPGQTVANGAMVKLSGAGELCVYALRDVHLIVDISGVWS
jgi:hypothetical protein